jgi:hypothetical protein
VRSYEDTYGITLGKNEEIRNLILAAKNKLTKKPTPGKAWTATDDQALLELCDYYDVNFGDPWMYISHALERNSEECRLRWLNIYQKPKQRELTCEIALTKSTRPLLMNRQFRMLPPQMYVIPSEKNFPLHPLPEGATGANRKFGDFGKYSCEHRKPEEFPKFPIGRGLQEFRDPEIF